MFLCVHGSVCVFECFFKDAYMCIKLLPPIEPLVGPIMHGWWWSTDSHLYWCVFMYMEVSIFECFLKDACIWAIDHTHNPNHDLWGSLIGHKLSCLLSVCYYHLFQCCILHNFPSFSCCHILCIYYLGEINRKISNIQGRLNMIYWMGLDHDMKSPKLSFRCYSINNEAKSQREKLSD